MTPLSLSPPGSGLDAAPPPSGARDRPRAAAEPSAFARELRQRQDSANRTGPQGERTRPDAAADAAEPDRTDAAAQRQRAADARARGKAGAAGEHPQQARPDRATGGPKVDDEAQADAATPAGTEYTETAEAQPAAACVAALNPVALQAGVAGAGAAADGEARGASNTAPGTDPTVDAAAAAATEPAALAAPAAARVNQAAIGAGRPQAAFQPDATVPDAVATRPTRADPAGTTAAPMAPAFSDVLAATGAAEPRAQAQRAVAAPDSPAAPPPLAGEIEADVGSPGFAPALGARLTLLARDGVQEARLALHPADLGPITVQIAVEGAAAHIHFLAEQAATRSAIESSLPQLAAALREGGFTLAGGGVMQQGPGSGGQNARADRPRPAGRGAGGADAGETVLGVQEVAARRAGTPRGVVDLYA